MSHTRLGRAAFFYPVLKVVICCIPFLLSARDSFLYYLSWDVATNRVCVFSCRLVLYGFNLKYCSQTKQFREKSSEEPGFELGAAGWEARMLPLCHAAPEWKGNVFEAKKFFFQNVLPCFCLSVWSEGLPTRVCSSSLLRFSSDGASAASSCSEECISSTDLPVSGSVKSPKSVKSTSQARKDWNK